MKEKPVIGWGWILAACVMLMNPMPMLTDVLPDALGFLFLWLAFRRVSAAVPAFEDVQEAGKRMLLITALKIPAWVMMLVIWGGDARQRSIIAVFCLVFSILELCYLIPWIHRLFEAFDSLGEHWGCDAALSSGEGKFRMAPEKLEKFTIGFFSVRAVLSCLPEMALVPVYDNTVEYTVNWNALYVPFMIGASVLVLLCGIVWYLYFAAYLRRMARDTQTALRLAEAAAAVPVKRKRMFSYLKAATLCYILAVLASFDFYINYVNYLPDVISALLFCGCGYCLWRILGGKRIVWILPLLYGGASLVHTVLFNLFFSRYSIGAIERVEAAESAYRGVLVSAGVGEALLAATVVVMFFALREVVDRYTGIPGVDERYIHTEQATRRELTRKSLFVAILGCLSAGVSFFYEFTLANTVDVATDPAYTSGRLTIPKLDWFPLVVYAVGVLWLILALHTFSRLRQEAEINLSDDV